MSIEPEEPPVGTVVAYSIKGELHLAWREPCADHHDYDHWHVMHDMAYGWRTWREIVNQDGVRVLGVHGGLPR